VEGRELQRVEPGGQAEHVVSAEGDVLDHIELYPLSRQLAEALKAAGYRRRSERPRDVVPSRWANSLNWISLRLSSGSSHRPR
jgi:hypothetical protein